MLQPSWRSAFTRSPMGRSCMRGMPLSSKSPPRTASAAVSGRMAVPALPRNRACLPGTGLPAMPVMRSTGPDCSILQPSALRATNITRVSSESSRSWMVVVPSHRAASSSTRLEMLLEPGRVTSPCAPVSAGKSRNSVENIIYSSWRSCSSCHGCRWLVQSSPPVHRDYRWKSSLPWLAGCVGKFCSAPATLHGWRP